MEPSGTGERWPHLGLRRLKTAENSCILSKYSQIEIVNIHIGEITKSKQHIGVWPKVDNPLSTLRVVNFQGY